MKKIAIAALALFVAVACVTDIEATNERCDAASSKIINTSDSCAQGLLLVKMVRYVETYDFAVEGISIESAPLFPAGNASAEELHSESIYRWWRLSFDENIELERIAKQVAKDDNVQCVQYSEIMKHVGINSEECAEERITPKRSATRAWVKELPFNDEYLIDQWHYNNDGYNYNLDLEPMYVAGADINLFPAWKYCAGDPRIIVAVIDGGVKYNHQDLEANMWVNSGEIADNGIDDDGNGYVDDIHGYNFLSGSGTLSFDSHGTHVAGTIAAVNNNNYGVCGIAGGTGNNDGCRIMSCEINDAGNFASDANVAAAIKYAADNGAVIMNCSWVTSKSGVYTSDKKWAEGANKILLDAITYFENNAKIDGLIDGGIAIFAAYNEGKNPPGYPAAYYKNICVTAFGPNFIAGPYTNYGPGSNICAPGGTEDGYITKIISTDITSDGTGQKYGTSMATPHVSGCAALGLSYALKIGKSFTRDEFKALILTSVHDIDQYQTDSKYKGQLGSGYIDAHLLLMQIEGTPCIYIKQGKTSTIALDEYFGEGYERLTYTSVEMSAEDKSKLGCTLSTSVNNGTITLTCQKSGTARLKVKAIVGGTTVGGGDNIGGMEIEREFEVVVRKSVASNGAWL